MNKNTIFKLVLLVLVTNNLVEGCPEMCICDIWKYLKRTSCVGKKLISIDTFVPSKTEALDLSSNVIYTVPDYGFKDLIYLQYVNLSSNHMGHLSLRSFEGLTQLKTLDLSYNNLQGIIPEMFKTNIHLKTLILTGNQFFIMDTYAILISNSIEVLLLNKCLISYIYEENFSELKNLRTLDLSGNLLATFKATNIYENPHLKTLNLKNNHIICKDNPMINLKLHCNEYNMTCQTDCDVERSQKMIVFEPEASTTQEYTPWNEKDFDDITTIHSTTTEGYYEQDCKILIPIVIAFSAGMIVGILNAGLCACVLISAKKHWRRRKERLINDSEVRWSLTSPVPHIRFFNDPHDNANAFMME